MTEAYQTEPDLHLPPEVITNASKAIAQLYSSEARQDKWGIDTQVKVPTKPSEKELLRRDEGWREVARKFPYLEPQIMGLRSVLRNARRTKDTSTLEKFSRVREFLIRGISFKERVTENFLIDILFRRIMIEEHPGFTYDSSDFFQGEADSIREELKLQEGKSDLKLQDAVKAVLTGMLSLTRQTPPPVRIS